MGIQWFNLRSSPLEGDSYNFTISIVMLYADAVIYALATWYIEAVFPGEASFCEQMQKQTYAILTVSSFDILTSVDASMIKIQ